MNLFRALSTVGLFSILEEAVKSSDVGDLVIVSARYRY
jgi:hypothetical protein